MTGSLLNLFATLLILSPVILAQQTICPCPDLNGTSGVYYGWSSGLSIECAYPDGSCVWNVAGTLLNTAQTNCQPSITPGSCPSTDSTGQPGELIHELVSYQCVYHPRDSDINCAWNAIGQPLYAEPDCGGLTVPLCYYD